MFQAKQPHVKLSELASVEDEDVPKKRRAYLDTSPRTNQDFNAFANKSLRKQAGKGVDSVWNDELDNFSEKFFYLDHTAEVLENYTKI